MMHSPWTHVIVILMLVVSASAAAAQTTVDTVRRTVRVDFANLPPYEQITLEGVTGLYWCSCLDPDNPSTTAGTGFTVNGPDLDMQYEGATPPAENHITYAYVEEYDFEEFELVDWIVVTESNGNQFRLVADRPIMVPEPTLATGLYSSIALALVWFVRSGSRTARVQREIC